MTTPKKTTHGKHKTTHVVHGKAGRRKVAHRPAPKPADPPKPANAQYITLDKDPKYGAEFRYTWVAGACFNATCTQRHIAIRSPANWSGTYIVAAPVPEIPVLRAMRFHKRIAPQFQAFFKAAAAKGLGGKVLSFGGTFVPRTLTKKPTVRSNHALGTAIDINAEWNPYGGSIAPRGSKGSVCELADFCADFGLYWGGWYGGNKDGMHFEAVRVLEAAELATVCAKHGVNVASLASGNVATPAKVPLPPPRPPGI